MRIALDPDFTESLVVVPAGAPGEAINLTYDLGAAAANNEIKTILRGVLRRRLRVAVLGPDRPGRFHARLHGRGRSGDRGHQIVDLSIPTEGVLNMRFFADYADTAPRPGSRFPTRFTSATS